MKTLDILIEQTEELFFSQYNTYPSTITSAPGRINIIGEHTDYSEGLSLPAAINRWVCIAFRKRNDQKINAYSHNYNKPFNHSIFDQPQHTSSWSKFLWGAFKILQNEYNLNCGFDCVILGNIPLGSGVSSSAALEMALINGLDHIFELKIPPLQKTEIGQQIEHRFLGVKCGLLDQFAVQFSSANNMLLIDFLQYSHHVVSSKIDGYSWALVNTMISRELASSAYTIRVNEMTDAFTELKSKNIQHMRDVSSSDINRISTPVLRQRVNHFITENQRLIHAVEAVELGDATRLGQLLYESHQSLQNDYQVSCPELDFLAKTAIKSPGCTGSRMMGGGFGGCTINLVETNMLRQFEDSITKAYHFEFGKLPGFDVFQLVDGAKVHQCDTNVNNQEYTTL